MKTCPSPTGSLLPAQHRPFLADLLRILTENGFRKSKLDPLLPRIVDAFAELCSTHDDLRAWYDELGRWVSWYRVPGYWLTYIFQLVTQVRKSTYHFVACERFSDAQTNFADDIALSSLETAYSTYIQNRAILGEAYEQVGSALQRKLRFYYDYYYHWSRPFEYWECNPCADHLYTSMSQSWLVESIRDQDDKFDIDDAGALSGVIGQCQGDEFAFYGVLARRFLGLLHASHGQHALSAEQFQLALAEARRLNLDTEIGHLRRLLGCALRAMGNGDEARHQFEQAYAYEKLEPLSIYTTYWQALSARELGDTVMRFAGRHADVALSRPEDAAVIIDDPEKLRPALNAYHDGRMFLNGHMSAQCPFPIARAAKQQIFRSFSNNAIQAACMLQSPKDVLAEVEWSGPREATEVVTEIAAAREIGQVPLADFRRNRAIYYQTLNTVPSRFEDYLANLEQYNAARRAYLEQSFALDSTLIMTQWCDKIVEQTLALRLPDTVFLLFHVGSRASIMILIDMSSGVAAPFPVAFGEGQLRVIHEEYLNKAKDANTRRLALDKLMSNYADMLGPVLEPVLRFLPGKHLKIFPRLQMNGVPLHALRLQGKYLIEHCATISYGQTLGLFLESHSSKTERHDTALRIVMGGHVPWYELLLPKIRERYAGAVREEHQILWQELTKSLTAQPAGDTLFACHGKYNAGDLDGSDLELAATHAEGKVLFSRVFAELDLRGCRSVIMGACESGLARAEIGAEYIGLPSAMLSSGVRYVIGALWTIPQMATAVLVDRYLELIKDESINVCAALCHVQREVMIMTRDQLSSWVQGVMASHPELDKVLQDVAGLDEHPFAHPYHWAGMQVVGDV
ncbi:MAG: CHAT domain-containing protein [Methyloceanibacter sp.]